MHNCRKNSSQWYTDAVISWYLNITIPIQCFAGRDGGGGSGNNKFIEDCWMFLRKICEQNKAHTHSKALNTILVDEAVTVTHQLLITSVTRSIQLTYTLRLINRFQHNYIDGK